MTDGIAELEERAARMRSEEEAAEAYSAALTRLLRGKINDSGDRNMASCAFFATLTMRLKREPDWGIPTGGVEGKTLKYNPDWLLSLSADERVAILAHEVLHRFDARLPDQVGVEPFLGPSDPAFRVFLDGKPLTPSQLAICNLGDPARRAGNEMMFQALAEQNVETLKSVNAKKVVTSCPHCLHTLRHDYPQFGGKFKVIPHSKLIEHLLEAGRLDLEGMISRRIDLGDVNDAVADLKSGTVIRSVISF